MKQWHVGNFVLFSTKSSKAERKISLLAILEILISVGVYWWLAGKWGTQIHIIISLFAAPLFLLTSDKSRALEELMWETYFLDKESPSEKPWKMLTVIMVSSGLVILLMPPSLPDIEGYKKFINLLFFFVYVWCVVLLYYSLTLGSWGYRTTLIMTLDEPSEKESPTKETFKVSLYTKIVISILIASGIGGFVDFNSPSNMYEIQSIEVWEIVKELLGVFIKSSLTVILFIAFVILFCSFAVLVSATLGVYIKALAIRFLSVTLCILEGIKSAPENWQKLLICEDINSMSHLIPDIDHILRKKAFETSADSNYPAMDDQKHLEKNGFALGVVFSIWYLPNLIWRMSLKSTIWFYAPIFLISRRGSLADPDYREAYFLSKPTIMTKWGFYLAIIALVMAALASIDWPLANKIWQGIDGKAPFSPVSWLFIVNWEWFINQPWKWFSFPATVLTIIIYLWQDHIRKLIDGTKKAGLLPSKWFDIQGSLGSLIYYVDRLRNFLVITSFLVGLWYFVKISYLNGQLKPLNPWLSSVFGPIA